MSNELLAAFGITDEDLKEAKEEKKNSSARTEKKKAKKKKIKEYALPLRFCGGCRQMIIQREGTITQEELRKAVEESFSEITGMITDFEVIENVKEEEGVHYATYLKPVMSFTAAKEDSTFSFPLTIMAGECGAMDFDQELSLHEIMERWIESSPEFEGCSLHYNEKADALIPFFIASEPAGVEYDLPVTVGIGSMANEATSALFGRDKATYEELREKLSQQYPEYMDCGFVYNQKLNLLVPVMQCKSRPGETVNQVLLPVVVRAGGFNMTVQPEDINGQRIAALEEIRKVVEKIYPEYSKERTEMLYDEEKKFVIPILKSSRKGLIVHNTRTAWEHIEEFDKQGNKWRKEVRPYGVFKRNESQKGALSFQLTAPKIPGEFLDQIVIRFRKDPSKEAAFQIFYDIETQEYELYEPVQKRSKTSVHFIRNHRLETEKTLMMDIHSHGMMEAFFSGIDDRDEKGVQLYMVLGNLNCSSPSLKLRAGMAGHFLNLSLHDVFEEGSAI